MPPRCLVAFVALMGVLLAGIGRCTDVEGHRLPPSDVRIQGITLDAPQAPDTSVLEHLHTMGVTHVTLVSFGFQPGYTVPEIRMHNHARWFSESDAGIRALARQADSLGLHIILKPHIWVGEYSQDGQNRHTIGFDTEAAWHQWEAEYETFLMHYAHLAQEINAPVLVVGTELANVARTREAFWRRLIAGIRTVYDGELTYAANWWEEYEQVPFWDALDYIGIQGYFELTTQDNPTLETLRAGWRPHKAAMQRLARRVGKPVLFTEIGYRNAPDAAAEPWRWPARGEADTVPPDDALQERLYQAFFESLWHEPWFAGAILWKWHPETEHRRQRRYLDFSPQNKPAEAIIAQWFTGRAASSH